MAAEYGSRVNKQMMVNTARTTAGTMRPGKVQTARRGEGGPKRMANMARRGGKVDGLGGMKAPTS